MNRAIVHALLAAALFGASTPLAKLLVGQMPPMLLAALLYLGSGIGLGAWLGLRRLGSRHRSAQAQAPLTTADLPWLAGATLCGGLLGPVLLMTGLATTPAASASLLLNLEGVLTAVLAWLVFREGCDRRVVIGMALIVLGGTLLSWEKDALTGVPHGALYVAGACLCWAIDNNLTRKIAASDATQIAAIKGMVAGAVNLGIALLWLQQPLPPVSRMALAGIIGFCGYGLSLVLFVLALRNLGAARTGAYFSAAPFAGAALALLLLNEAAGPQFWLAAALMAVGIWLHVTETHDHAHRHPPLQHAHAHTHDDHHQHAHDFEWDGKEPHSHPHQHEELVHAHPHFPDIHHRHRH